MSNNKLKNLTISGYKSIGGETSIDFRARNVFIGQNGAGKSNLISFFRLLNWAMPSPGNLQFHVGRCGGASTFLFDGPSKTPQIVATLAFETDQGTNEYHFRLFHAAGDTLVFADERFRYYKHGGSPGKWFDMGAGHKEPRLIEYAQEGKKLGYSTARFIHYLLRDLVVHQFHNTSETARVRTKWPVSDNRLLKEDAANLASVLFYLKESEPTYYRRIVESIRQVAPFFADFELAPEGDSIFLRWRERGSDVVFGAHQMSDGTLRMIALVTLLLQPEDRLPSLIVLDEPELGLHPAAVTLVATLLKDISERRQVVVATQSPSLIDEFDPEDVVVVNRVERESTFERLDPDALVDWLSEYRLSDLWDKNVVGGRP